LPSPANHLAVAAVELVEIDKVAEVAGAVAVEVLLLQFVELVAVALGVGFLTLVRRLDLLGQVVKVAKQRP